MQSDGWQQRPCEDFVVERQQMLGYVRVGGYMMGMESSPVPGSAFDEEENEMRVGLSTGMKCRWWTRLGALDGRWGRFCRGGAE